MKKLDKLVLKSFLGPFFLTFVVVVFILLLQYMLKYFDDLVGKGLGFEVIAELMTSFSIVMTPNALPLAVLLSSLMTFGNLGEHFELTAIKGAGVSLLRTMSPIFFFTLGLTFLAFFSNNFIVPKAALNAYSLMYDVRQQKPALNIKEGAFYNGIEGYTIRANKKMGDGLMDVLIYDHTQRKGNVDVIMADSGGMYSFMNNKYLVMELYHGSRYKEGENTSSTGRYDPSRVHPYVRSSFDHTKMFFSLEDFDLKKTKKELFANNRLMKNILELDRDIDSMRFGVDEIHYKVFQQVRGYYSYHMDDKLEIPDKYIAVKERLDSIRAANDSIQRIEKLEKDMQIDSIKRIKNQHKDIELIADNSQQALNRNENKVVAATEKPVNKGDENKTKANPFNPLANLKLLDAKKQSTNSPDSNKIDNQTKKTPVAEKTVKKPKKKSVEKKDLASMPKRKRNEPQNMEDVIRRVDSIMELDVNRVKIVTSAVTKARQMKNHMVSQRTNEESLSSETRKYTIEKNKKYALALACLAMFFIGAPLGAIIKKGGLGVPVILSIVFFIMFYVLNITGEKLAKQDLIQPWIGAWVANFVLFPIGIVFMRQAYIDARLFDMDFYAVFILKVKKKLGKKREIQKVEVV